MDRLVVTGVDSLMGNHIAATLSDRFEVIGLWQRVPVTLPGVQMEQVAWDQLDKLAERLDTHDPDWIVHCGPMARSAWDELPAWFDEIEPHQVPFAKVLLDWTEKNESELSVMSTDAVFAGPRLFHAENCPPTGGGPLASVAREVEDILEGTHALVVRTHAYGVTPEHEPPCFAEWLWNALSDGQVVALDAERHATPVPATAVAEMVAAAYEKQMQGLLHIGGSERVNCFRFGAEMALAGGFSGKHVRFKPSNHTQRYQTLMCESSLNVWRARRVLKQVPPAVRDGLAMFAQQMQGSAQEAGATTLRLYERAA
jgi:dTDP-4-dehydrorhamnose reductase